MLRVVGNMGSKELKTTPTPSNGREILIKCLTWATFHNAFNLVLRALGLNFSDQINQIIKILKKATIMRTIFCFLVCYGLDLKCPLKSFVLKCEAWLEEVDHCTHVLGR